MTIDLKAIEERCARATKGPWEITHGIGSYEIKNPKYSVVHSLGIPSFSDADFIAHSREDLPALLALVREAIPCIEAYRDISAALQQVDDYQWAVEWLAKVEDK